MDSNGSIDVLSKPSRSVKGFTWEVKYRKLDVLDEGGMGQVLRVHDLRQDRPVALKQPLRDDSESLARFAREIKEQRKAASPFVMPILEFDPEHKWYAMPLAKHSLRDVAGRMYDIEVLNAFLQIAHGLKAAHKIGVVHRDVKPRNIFWLSDSLEPTGRWVLGDFGLVTRGRDGTTIWTHGPVGTPGYIAPEVQAAPGSATAATDVYSLGCTLSWVVTGQTPVLGGKIASRPPWEAIVSSMTERELAHRLSNTDAVIDRLSVLKTKLREERAAVWGRHLGSAGPETEPEKAVLFAVLGALTGPSDDEAVLVSELARHANGQPMPLVILALRTLLEKGLVTGKGVDVDNFGNTLPGYALTSSGWAWLQANQEHLPRRSTRVDGRDEGDLPF